MKTYRFGANTYGSNPAIHGHIAENHPNVLKNVKEANIVRWEYRQKLKDAIDVTERIINALDNETLYRQLSIALKAEP